MVREALEASRRNDELAWNTFRVVYLLTLQRFNLASLVTVVDV